MRSLTSALRRLGKLDAHVLFPPQRRPARRKTVRTKRMETIWPVKVSSRRPKNYNARLIAARDVAKSAHINRFFNKKSQRKHRVGFLDGQGRDRFQKNA
jgi:hypothetical protein